MLQNHGLGLTRTTVCGTSKVVGIANICSHRQVQTMRGIVNRPKRHGKENGEHRTWTEAWSLFVFHSPFWHSFSCNNISCKPPTANKMSWSRRWEIIVSCPDHACGTSVLDMHFTYPDAGYAWLTFLLFPEVRLGSNNGMCRVTISPSSTLCLCTNKLWDSELSPRPLCTVVEVRLLGSSNYLY